MTQSSGQILSKIIIIKSLVIRTNIIQHSHYKNLSQYWLQSGGQSQNGYTISTTWVSLRSESTHERSKWIILQTTPEWISWSHNNVHNQGRITLDNLLIGPISNIFSHLTLSFWFLVTHNHQFSPYYNSINSWFIESHIYWS